MRILILPLMVCAAFAQTKPDNELKVWFPDRAGLAIHTESSRANSPLSTSGSVAVGGGNYSHRVVLDKAGQPLFAYDIEVRKAAGGGVILRIKPSDRAKLEAENWYTKVKAAGPRGDIPTLTGAREFPPLKVGDAVQVDILRNPETGETIWDVLRVIDEPAPVIKPVNAAGERFSFERVKVVIDGKTIADHRNTWMIGNAIKMRVPSHGEYYLLLAPPTELPFVASGWVDHNVLRFKAGGESIEITGMSNLLQRSDYGTVWVYHVPDAKPAKNAGSVDFTCADNMDQLLDRE